MRKLKKQLLRTMIACGLVISVAVGSTVAYLTDAETATNTFTVGNVQIDLEEPGYPGNDSDEVKNIIPNQEIVKDPQIENTGNNDALAFLRVEVPQEMFTDEDDGTGEQKKQDLFRLKGVSSQWELLRTETVTGEDGKAKTSYVYGYKKTLGKGTTTDKLFQKVQMKNAVESDLSGNVEDIVVTACAIQATDIPDVNLTPGSDGNLSKDVLDQVYTIFLNQSGNQTSRPADEGNRNQTGKLGKISYELDGGTLASGSLTEYGSADYGYTPPAPAKKNYTFTGWEPENIPSGSTGKVTLTAKWTPTVLGSILYNLNGGSLADEKTSYTVEDYEYTPPAPTKENYTFNGWSPANIPSGSTGTVTLTAKWTADVLGNISYNLDGGSMSGEKASYTADDYGYVPPMPKKKGYTFDGWTPKNIASGNKGDVTFTANWISDTLGSIQYNLDGGTLAGEKTSYSSLDYGYTPPTPTKPDYKFAGWEPSKLVTGINGNVVFTAKWAANTATLLSGKEINVKMKQFTKSYTPTESTTDTSITAIQHSDVAPSANVMASSRYIISTEDSGQPVYMWYEKGTVKWWSEAQKINAGTDLSYLCRSLTKLTDISGLSTWNTKNVTDMTGVFWNCANITDISALSSWRTENVISMNSTFDHCSSLTDLSALANWNTGKITSLSGAFSSCSNITKLDGLAAWKTNNVTNMSYTFSGCKNLTDISSLSDWNAGKVTSMSYMFSDCRSLTNVNGLSKWNAEKVTSMYRMFRNCNSLTNLNGLSKWNTGNVTSMDFMFYMCSSLADLSALANWDTKNVTTMQYMFTWCGNLADTSSINDWDVAKVKTGSGTNSGFYQMFQNCPSHPIFTKRAGIWDQYGTFIPTTSKLTF